MKIVCIASGPSLTQEDVDYCRGKADKVYVTKECFKMAPWADLCYAADADWWDFWKGLPEFKGEKWTCEPEAAKKWGITHIPYRVDLHWSKDKSVVATGGNSGFQLVNLAELHGATEIILLGYDLGFKGGDKHWWDKTIKRDSRPSNYNEWIKRWHLAVPHITAKVYNATRQTYLTCFPRVELKDVL